MGAHTTLPVLGMPVRDFRKNTQASTRGFIYIVDRADTGMHILELTGSAREVADFR